MNGYPYPTRPYPGSSAANQPLMDMTGGDGINSYDMSDGQSLDDIVFQNDSVNRRQSMPVYARQQQQQQQQQQHMQMGSPDTRRLSMLNFGGPNGGSMGDFQFDLSNSPAMDNMMPPNTSYPTSSADMQSDGMPAPDMGANPHFAAAKSPYSNMAASGSAYASPIHPNASLDMDINPYSNNMSMSVSMDNSLNNMMQSDMALFPPGNQFSQPINQGGDFVGPLPGPQRDALQPRGRFESPSMSNTPETLSGNSANSGKPSRTNSQDQVSMRSASRPESEQRNSSHSSSLPTQLSLASLKNQRPIAQDPRQSLSGEAYEQIKNMTANWSIPSGGFPSTMHSNPHQKTQFKDAYSSSGFDMLGVLMRVATRPNPRIDIGSVDLSCAFVVCDADMDDIPIVYCSENFERLTGYTRHMILGRNCRFLQSPDGKVESGIKRKYVDDESVLYLKNTISAVTEAQISLINYRRGGQPFMNLLTMIPISWEPGGNIKYFVGFQVDLVEQPGAVTNMNGDGSYRVNYHRGMSMPSYVFNDAQKPQPDSGQTISKDEVSNVLASYNGSGDSEITRRIWDKVLLENTDDVVHVLSLKGLFMYLSPSSNRILEYDPSELVGSALSSVCHPSDIVPVTRELKETTNGGSVSVVFRIRRKRSGYMWFEGHGSLHTEQGKGRKCIILVGRERPVYTLSKAIVRESGGIGDNELWTKMSTSGMFLFVSSNVRQLLDRQPQDLVGTSIQALMRQESKVNFGRVLEVVRSGKKGEVKHEMINKRGQVLQAFTTIYPGDATEGHKPTFVVGQTRLLKYSRNSSINRSSMYTTKESTGGSQTSLTPLYPRVSSLNQVTGPGSASGSITSHVASPNAYMMPIEENPATFAGHDGLQIGHQDLSLASDDNVFDELKTTRSTSWQYELRQMEKQNRYLAEEVQSLLAAKKKRKRRKGAGQLQKDCANCHTRTTPEWRRGPSGNRDLCNSCGLRWAKQQGRMSPRSTTSDKSKKSASPRHPIEQQRVIPEQGPSSSTHATPGKKSPEGAGVGAGADTPSVSGQKHARSENDTPKRSAVPPTIDEE